MTTLPGVLVTVGVVLLGTVVLVAAAIGAMIGFAVALVVMPWLMPVLGYVLRRRAARRASAPGSGASRRSPEAPGGYTWTESGGASVPAR